MCIFHVLFKSCYHARATQSTSLLGICHTCTCNNSSCTNVVQAFYLLTLALASCMRVGCHDFMNMRLPFRFFGVHPSNGGKSGKWSSSAMIKGHLYFIGNHLSEEHAAQAYDKVRIYQASVQPYIGCRVHVVARFRPEI